MRCWRSSRGSRPASCACRSRPGAPRVQLFDSWAGGLAPADYRASRRSRTAPRCSTSVADLGVPRIHFGVDDRRDPRRHGHGRGRGRGRRLAGAARRGASGGSRRARPCRATSTRPRSSRRGRCSRRRRATSSHAVRRRRATSSTSAMAFCPGPTPMSCSRLVDLIHSTDGASRRGVSRRKTIQPTRPTSAPSTASGSTRPTSV